MKIDYVCIGYWPITGGTETVVKNIAERMVKRGHDVTVHTSTYNPNYSGKLNYKETINGVKILRYRLLPAFIFLPKIDKPQIVHLFSYGDNFIIQSLLHRSNFLVSSPIGEEIYSRSKIRNRLLGKRILNLSKIIFAMTTFEKYLLNVYYSINIKKIVIWPAGVKDENFEAPNLVNVRKDILNVSKTQYFTRLARLDRIKKIEFGIKLLEHVVDLTYVVVGTLDDMDYLNELKALAKKLGVDGRLVFTGSVNEDEKRLLLHSAQFYLIANQETFGSATIEAMAQGVPIIAPDLDEYKDIVIDRVNSLVYKFDSIVSCKGAVELLQDNASLRQELGINGRLMAKERFHWDRITDVAENIYKHILNSDL